jgi:hypothetical protein
MELMMYLSNDLIEAVPVNLKNITLPGYLGNIKRKLEKKYTSLINQANTKPEFLIVHITGKDNSMQDPRSLY